MASPTRDSSRCIGDLEIEQWVQAHYGFVPHPFWICHCKKLYIQEFVPSSVAVRRPWHECPAENRAALKAAFVHFGMLPQ